MTHFKFTVVLTILTNLLFGQTTVDTKTIAIKNVVAKKIIKQSDDIYILLFDANDFVLTLDTNETTQKKLTDFFATSDTLTINHHVEKQLNLWLTEIFKTYRNSALAFGKVSIYNKKTRKFETHLLNKNTVIIDRKEKIQGSFKSVDEKISATYELLSADTKHKFVTSNITQHSSSSN